MKRCLLIAVLGYGLTMPLLAQSSQKITIKLKNNGLLPREFKFVTRQPNSTYPNVFTSFLLPGAVYKGTFRVGTSIIPVSQAEITETMKGRNVTGKPLLIVTATDNEKTFKLLR